MAILPMEQQTQRFPKGMVCAHGVVLWETRTTFIDPYTPDITVVDAVEPLEVEMAAMPHYEDQGGSEYTDDGFEREGAFGSGYFGSGYFGGDDET